MSRGFRVLAALFLLSIPSAVTALSREGSQAPLEAVADFFRPHVYEMKEELFFYNWAVAPDNDPSSLDRFPSRGPKALGRAEDLATRYWKSAGKPSSDSYGPGFYLALDAASTRRFGDSPHWLLTEFRMPVGFRVINLVTDGRMKVPLKIRRLVTAFGCPAEWERSNTFFDQLFGNKGGVQESCIQALFDVFQTRLKIDGFFYPYISSHFTECPQPEQGVTSNSGLLSPTSLNRLLKRGFYPERNAAFVVTSGKNISIDNVRLFNPESRDERDDRIRIMSLVYKAAHDDLELVGGRVLQAHSDMSGLKSLRLASEFSMA